MKRNRTRLEFILFDSAIVPLARILSVIHDGYTGHCLYATLDEEAKRVSPWLLERSPPAEQLADEMRHSKRYASGVSRLSASVAIDGIVMHLHRLQTVFANRKRYYLRYADGRAFSDLWNVLNLEQRKALLGPVTVWEACPLGDSCLYTVAPDIQPGLEAVALPLRLTSRQCGELIRAQRDTQRWSTWVDTQPRLCDAYSLAELRELSHIAGERLRARGALSPAEVQAIELEVLRSAGKSLAGLTRS